MNGGGIKCGIWYKGGEGRGHHVRHDIPVVVLQRPQHPPFGADDPGNRVVDERKEIFDPGLLKFIFPAGGIFPVEDFPETGIIDFGNRVLRAELAFLSLLR